MSASNAVLLSNQLALSRALDIVANNIANANTTGFKREGISFDTYLSQNGTANPTRFVVDRSTYRDTSNGPIVPTSNPLDLAIQGSGYFQVQLPNGSTGYTRAGAFQLSPDGDLITQAGQKVLGEGGQGISIPQTASQINISGDGYVTARVDNGAALAQVGKISIVGFANEQELQSAGNGIYTTSQAATLVTSSAIVQGSIEQSNVSSVKEITNLIQISRAYEQASNIINNENQRQSDAVTRLTRITAA